MDQIAARCALFACRVCRTKTGWPHQRWCSAAETLRPGCRDCRYWDAAEALCRHPAHRAEGVLSQSRTEQRKEGRRA